MRLRTKLYLSFTIIAALVPLLGALVVWQSRSISHRADSLVDRSFPEQQQAVELQRIQSQQYSAALSYLSDGRPEDRQRYQELTVRFNDELASLQAVELSTSRRDRIRDIEARRSGFLANGNQLIAARERRDVESAATRASYEAMVQDLSTIQRRFVPAGQATSDVSVVSAGVRSQFNDPLAGTEGMLNHLAREMAQATAYTMARGQGAQPPDSSGAQFSHWAGIAYNSGSAEDRAAITRVQDRFRTFETGVRAMKAASDGATSARTAVIGSDESVHGSLVEYLSSVAGDMAQAERASESAVSGVQLLIVIFSVGGIALGAILAAVLSTSITRPLRRLLATANAISTSTSATDLEGVSIDVDSGDEIGELAAAFRRMLISIRILAKRDAESESSASDLKAAKAS